MERTVIALERDGMDIRALAFRFQILKPDLDLHEAVKAAVTEYIATTETGRNIYRYNCDNFNWGDLASTTLPEDLCVRHGFRIIPDDEADEIVDWDEDLVNESNLPPDEDDENDDFEEEDNDV